MSLAARREFAVMVITFSAFVDILAYSIAVPVLPDISRRYGASPTTIGLLFASFGLTVLIASVPMGALADRVGRRLPLAAGAIGLAGASVLFAVAPSMPWLFAGRLLQGAADTVTWVVGLAVVADLYPAGERGRVMGLVMSGTTLGFLLGPTIGGWLYETGGPTVPYLTVAALALLAAAGCASLQLPGAVRESNAPPLRAIVQVRSVGVCVAAVVAGGGTIAMIEPVLSLFLADTIGLGPARIGLVFGAAAIVAALLHPVFGHVADRVGSRQLTLAGLGAIGLALPTLALAWSFASAAAIYAVGIVAVSMFISPSLAYMGEATARAGPSAFGVAYGLYNFAWAIGIVAGPALGGFLYERLGFAPLLIVWAIAIVAIALWLTSTEAASRRVPAV